ncbi:MAG: sigma-70 family RNA polymerase sigma factor [Actinobacteria bacterium]|nr:sigma-70 family RNA polymerase sigma factor [Actinomycetota bacterium]
MARVSHDDFLNATMPALDLVYNLARRMMRDPMLVEDVVQETYVKAFEAWASARKPRRVEPWIATICLNVGRGYWRKASTRYETVSDDLPEEVSLDDVEAQALSVLQQEMVHRALWQLPDEQRITITLMDIDGFTASEAAKIMQTPRGTVLSRAHRGRKRLAGLLEDRVSAHDT